MPVKAEAATALVAYSIIIEQLTNLKAGI